MNKYQEALDRLILNIGVIKSSYVKSGQAKEDVSVLQELVDKATPEAIKPFKLNESVAIGKQMFCKGTTFLSKCPKCGEWLHPYHHKKYCGNCGQCIDWSEDE